MSESIRSYQGHVDNFQGVMALLTWQDPVRTSIAFGECVGVLMLVQNGGILRFFLYVGYLALGVTALVEFATKFVTGGQSGLVSYFKPSKFLNINKEHLQSHADTIVAVVYEALYWARRVLDARDLKLTLMTFAGLFVVYGMTATVPFASMLTVFVVGAFTLPAFYLKFQKELDHAHGYFSNIFSDKANSARSQFMNSQFMNGLNPHLQKFRQTRDKLCVIFGITPGGGAPGAPPPAAAPAPMAAPPAPSVRSVKPPSMKAASVRSMKAPSAHGSAHGSVKSPSHFNSAMAAGAGAVGGAAIGAGAMGMAGSHGSVYSGHHGGGSDYGSDYYDEGSMYGSEYSYMSQQPPHH